MRSRDGAQDQENAPMSPDPFPRMRGGVWERDYTAYGKRALIRIGDQPPLGAR